MESKPVIDAGKLGFSPDASSAMNADAMRAAIDEAQRLGGVVFLAPGVYRMPFSLSAGSQEMLLARRTRRTRRKS